MKKLIEKRSIQLVLGLVVIVIWGRNLISIFDLTTSVEDKPAIEIVEIESNTFSIPEREKYSYQSNFSDPFKPELPAPKRKRTLSQSKEIPIVPPKLDLVGVIENTAQLINRRNQVHFVAKGDTIEGAIVTSVTPDSVVLLFKSEMFIVKF